MIPLSQKMYSKMVQFSPMQYKKLVINVSWYGSNNHNAFKTKWSAHLQLSLQSHYFSRKPLHLSWLYMCSCQYPMSVCFGAHKYHLIVILLYHCLSKTGKLLSHCYQCHKSKPNLLYSLMLNWEDSQSMLVSKESLKWYGKVM